MQRCSYPHNAAKDHRKQLQQFQYRLAPFRFIHLPDCKRQFICLHVCGEPATGPRKSQGIRYSCAILASLSTSAQQRFLHACSNNITQNTLRPVRRYIISAIHPTKALQPIRRPRKYQSYKGQCHTSTESSLKAPNCRMKKS